MGQSSQIPRILAFFTSKKNIYAAKGRDFRPRIQGSANAAVIKPRPLVLFFLTPFRHEFKRRFSLESGR